MFKTPDEPFRVLAIRACFGFRISIFVLILQNKPACMYRLQMRSFMQLFNGEDGLEELVDVGIFDEPPFD
jgi:hypothetical protein